MADALINTQKLQSIVNLISSMINVPAALIMRLDGDYIEVLCSSQSADNPYKAGDKEQIWNSGLYCEKVIKSNSILLVPDALDDDHWRINPDIEFDMISYLGLPIKMASGDIFGTICVLDNKRNEYNDQYISLLTAFRDMVEDQLQIVDYQIKSAQNEAWRASVRTLMHLVNNTMNQMLFFQLKMHESDDFSHQDISLFEKLLTTCSNELRKMSESGDIVIQQDNIGDLVRY